MAVGAGRPGVASMVIYLGADVGLAEGLRSHLASQGVGFVAGTKAADAAAALRGGHAGLLLIDARAATWGAAPAQDLTATLRELAPDGSRLTWVCISDPGDLGARLAALRGGALACYTSLPAPPELAARLLGLLGVSRANPYRVLVVDDQEVAAILAGGILNRAGMVVRTVSDAMTVLDVLEEFRPDLIVMDLHMPGVSGIELTSIIREHDEFFAVPIVFLSGEGDRDRQIDALRLGADEFLVKPVEPALLVQTVGRRIELARALHDRHASAAPRDPVTGIWSRGYLLQRIDQAILEGAAQDPGQGVIYINLDPSASLDALRRAGTLDAVLAQVGQLLRGAMGSNDIAARLGERSLALLVRRREAKLLEACAEGLRRAISGTPVAVGRVAVKLTASIGIGRFQPPVDDAITIVSRAKGACAKARQAGGDRVETYVPALSAGAGPTRSSRLAGLIREALRGNGFQLLYHPVVPVQQRPGERYEAVLRLRAPDGELIAPLDFLPAAAQAGLMPAIDRWVMTRALDDTVVRRETQPGLMLMVRQTLATTASADWADWLRDEIARRDLIRHRPVLIFDVDDVVANREAARACFEALKRLGIETCLNRLDETSAALEVLGQFPWSLVRLRPEALTRLGVGALTKLVSTVHQRGAQVIATGIEDPQAIARVWGYGVDFIQGHFIKAAGETLDFDFTGTELL